MIRASLYGRLGADPVSRATKIVAFGKIAEQLARHVKGHLAAFMGPLVRTHFVGRDGDDRASWSLTAEAVLSARTVRPGGNSRRQAADRSRPANGALAPNDRLDDLWQQS
jgi:single-stranded DNA-binding protein